MHSAFVCVVCCCVPLDRTAVPAHRAHYIAKVVFRPRRFFPTEKAFSSKYKRGPTVPERSSNTEVFLPIRRFSQTTEVPDRLRNGFGLSHTLQVADPTWKLFLPPRRFGSYRSSERISHFVLFSLFVFLSVASLTVANHVVRCSPGRPTRDEQDRIGNGVKGPKCSQTRIQAAWAPELDV